MNISKLKSILEIKWHFFILLTNSNSNLTSFFYCYSAICVKHASKPTMGGALLISAQLTGL
jgi:hypothetical protein